MPKVSVVIVSMNKPELLEGSVGSIRKYTGVSYEILLVAYMYSAENLALVREKYPEVQIVESSELRGFSENNNLALRLVKGEYVFVVNDDTFFTGDLIGALVADFERLREGRAVGCAGGSGRVGDEDALWSAGGPEGSDGAVEGCGRKGGSEERGCGPGRVAAISPKICFPDGRVQTQGRAPWTAWRYMKHYLHLVDETKPSKWSMKEGLFQTYTLNGAAFLADADAFRDAGFFDETYTFTPEDIALGDRFNRMGYSVWCDADVTLYHIANATASSIETAIKPTRVRGALQFYSGGNPLKYALLGAFVWLIESLRALKYIPLKKLNPRGAVAAPDADAPTGAAVVSAVVSASASAPAAVPSGAAVVSASASAAATSAATSAATPVAAPASAPTTSAPTPVAASASAPTTSTAAPDAEYIHNYIMFRTALNVRKSIFTRRSSKEIFIRFYNESK